MAERWVRLDHRILRSPQYRSLTPNARALLVEVAMMENGSNNGTMFLSTRDAAARMGVADPHTAAKAFDELETAGFIACTFRGTIAVKAGDRRASCWRLTWQSFPELRKPPTNDWTNREPADKRAKRRSAAGCAVLKAHQSAETKEGVKASERVSPVREYLTLNAASVRKNPVENTPKAAAEASNVRNIHTFECEKRQNPLKISSGIFHTHTAGQLEAVPQAAASPPIRALPARDPIATLSCERCRESFSPADRGKPKRFCSERCRKAAEAQRRHERQRAA